MGVSNKKSLEKEAKLPETPVCKASVDKKADEKVIDFILLLLIFFYRSLVDNF